MVRYLVERTYDETKKYVEGACIAADVATLPTTGIITGSKMTVANSGDVYMFSEGDSPAWNKIQTGPTAEG